MTNTQLSQLALYDTIRIVQNQLTSGMNIINDDFIEHRYEQRGHEYTLRSWRAREMTITKAMVDRPAWLVKIIDLAVVGGHTQTIPTPPPDLIVWFRTEKDTNNLITFVDFTSGTRLNAAYIAHSEL
jgi:hypothetical protein